MTTIQSGLTTRLVLLSILGLLVLQCKSSSHRNLITDFFIGLAVSTMTGDAFFHILPHMLGMHGHAHDDHHDHDHEPEVRSQILQLNSGLLSITSYGYLT